MNQKLHEHIWHFKLMDVETRDCAAYFRKRASEMAAALNCRLVAMSRIKVEHMRGDVRMVVGTALLENARGNVLAFPKSKRRQSS
jgi:hypothetical protein